MTKQYQGRYNLALFLAVVVGLLVMISFSGEGRKRLTPVENLLLALLAPVQTAFSSAVQSLYSLYDTAVSFHELKVENERLAAELSAAQEQNIQLIALRRENERLRRMLKFQERSAFEMLPAEVIARDPSQWFGTVTINRGFLDGVTREDPVITDRGLVGMVSAVSPNSSQIMLITDPRLAVSVKVLRSRDHGLAGIVESYANDTTILEMSKLSPDISIQLGDTIITSGLGAVFPEGIAVGRVKEVAGDQHSLVRSAIIRPAVNFNRLEEVFVITGGASDLKPPDENRGAGP